MKQLMPILYFSHFPHTQMGGQKSLLALIEHLDRAKYRPFAVVSENGELSEELRKRDCSVFFTELPEAKRTYFWQPWRLDARHFFVAAAKVRQIALDCEAKILHSDEESDAVLCGVVKRGTIMKTVYHVRLTNPCKLDRRIELAADRFIGVSEGTKQRWSLRALKRCSIIPDGLDCDVFSPHGDRLSAKRSLNLPENQFVVLFVGQVKEGKGIYDLIEAIGLLKAEISADKLPLLLIAGTPIDNITIPIITKRMEELQITQNTQIIGRQYNIEKWMQAADTIALPSHEGVEGLPRVLFEGMACGAIGLGTDVSGVREAILPQTGLLVPERSPRAIADALMVLMQQPEFAAALRAKGLESVRQRFDIRASAHAVEKVYESIFAERI